MPLAGVAGAKTPYLTISLPLPQKRISLRCGEVNDVHAKTQTRNQTWPPTALSLRLLSGSSQALPSTPTHVSTLLQTNMLSTAGRFKRNGHKVALGERRKGFSPSWRTTQTVSLFMTLLCREHLVQSRSNIDIRYRSKKEDRIISDFI